MSPSEDDLRRSLHDGEGEGLDVDRVVARAAAEAARRRARTLGVVGGAASVLVVAGLAVVLTRGGGTDDAAAPGPSGAATSTSGRQATTPAATGAPPTTGTTGTARASGDPACPAEFPLRALPGGGGTGQFGATGKLFARTVDRVVVCGYGTTLQSAGRGAPGRVVLSGDAARTLADSLESARTSPLGVACTDVRPTNRRSYAFLPVATDGTVLRTVTAQVTLPVCDTRVTDGTAVRWGWTPTGTLAQQLAKATPGGAVLPDRPQPTGKVIGSPVR